MNPKDEDVAAAIERVEAAVAARGTGADGPVGADAAAGPGGADGPAGTDGTGDPVGPDAPEAAPAADDGWAHRASFWMLLDDVAESRVVEALDEVAAQVTASGETPHELFGDPDDWVAERRARWREAGTEHVVRPRPGPLDLLGESLLTAAILSGLLFLYMLLPGSWGEPPSLGILLFPLCVGIIARAVQWVYTEVRSARSQAMGVLAAVGTTTVGVAATIGVIALTRDTTLGGPAALWLLGVGIVCAGLGLGLAIVAPERPARPAPAPRDAEEWFDALARALREREDMTGARAEEIVAESRAHVRDAGGAPLDEFGSPGAYAARFAGSPRVAGRRKAWFATALALLVLIYVIASLADGTAGVWGLLWLLLAAGLAVSAWRGVTRT